MVFRGFLGDDVSIYMIDDDGDLKWFRDVEEPAGALRWAPGSGRRIGLGWDFAQVFAGGDGVIYGIHENGDLLFYRDELRDGSNGRFAETGWSPASSAKIGWGWEFAHVFSSGDGVIYAIRENGDMHWYHDLARDGSNDASDNTGWDPRGGIQIGGGWDYRVVFAGRDGVIYGVSESGELVWHRDELRDGTNGADGSSGWAPVSGVPIAGGLQDVVHAFTRGRYIYLEAPDGRIGRVEAEVLGAPPAGGGEGLVADAPTLNPLATTEMPATPDPEGSRDE